MSFQVRDVIYLAFTTLNNALVGENSFGIENGQKSSYLTLFAYREFMLIIFAVREDLRVPLEFVYINSRYANLPFSQKVS